MKLWGLQPGAGIWLGGHATDGKRCLHQRLIDMPRPPNGPIEAGFISPESVDEALHFAQKLSKRLGPGKKLWILTSSQIKDKEPSIWHQLDNRMFDLGFTRIATVEVDAVFETLGYVHTAIA